MVALFVALLLILLVMYHAWIRNTPVLAGVMVPALIMLLYAAGVLFLAKREKQRRLLQENQLRATADTALNEIVVAPDQVSTSAITSSTQTTKSTPKTKSIPVPKEELQSQSQTNLKTNNLVPPKKKIKKKSNNPNEQSTTMVMIKNSNNNKSEESSKFEKPLPKSCEINELIKKRESLCLSRSLSAS